MSAVRIVVVDRKGKTGSQLSLDAKGALQCGVVLEVLRNGKCLSQERAERQGAVLVGEDWGKRVKPLDRPIISQEGVCDSLAQGTCESTPLKEVVGTDSVRGDQKR
jgi:hypothetical protein